MWVPADKTNNYYRMEAKDYKELQMKEVHKEYKKVDKKDIEKIKKSNKELVSELGLSDRVFRTEYKEAFNTLKDTKDNFNENPKTRLINPTKPEIGRISKIILERINKKIREDSELKQWRDTGTVIEWFKNIKNKKKLHFVQFDIEAFYPAITEIALEKALKFGEKFTEISENDKKIIMEARKVFLIADDSEWMKKENELFDVTMGAFDGAEICELIGLLALSEIEKINNFK